jgi:hypothetical protein
MARRRRPTVRKPIAFDLVLKLYPGVEDVVIIDIGSADIADWCVCLCLLEKRLVDSIRIADSRCRFSVVVVIDDLLEDAHISKVLSRGPESLTIALTPTECRRWMNVFLKYYRDGIFDVDHIDVDVTSEIPGYEQRLTVTFKGMAAVPPVSAEELARRLNVNWIGNKDEP